MSFGIVQDVGAGPYGALLKFRRPGETFYVVLAPRPPAGAEGSSAVGVLSVDEKRAHAPGKLPPGAPRDAKIERALEAAHLVGAEPNALHFQRGSEAFALVARNGRVAIVVRSETDAGPPSEADTHRILANPGTSLLGLLAEEALAARRRSLLHAIEKGLTKVRRRADAVRKDLEKMADAEGLLLKAQSLLPEAARTPRGASVLHGTDWSTGEAVPIAIPLDPSKGAKEQVTALFKRAQRLKLGRRFAEPRLASAELGIATLGKVTTRLRDATSFEELEALAREAKEVSPKDVILPDPGAIGGVRAARPRPQEASLPFRTFVGEHGSRILVGKGGAHNDELTLHVAKPHDLWLHAKNEKGAHVVVPLIRGKTCPGEVLVDAAHLAAHFSDVRGELTVEIEHTERRHLRKPKGAAPGLVVVTREKVLVLRVDEARTARLLATEQS